MRSGEISEAGKQAVPFIPNDTILNYEELFEADNLLNGQNDETQQVLLPYLQATGRLFHEVIKKYDKSDSSGCRVFPSLDLGFPNNVCRLAGGFATGMLLAWNCAEDIVPVDATVNVCTSSVFKMAQFDPDCLKRPEELKRSLERIFREAHEDKGYSFSFTSGNHFLMIARDENSGAENDHYLVLHSSANDLKNSYMGLYPVEGNWYAEKLKRLNEDNGRYIRYLTGDDARYFITMAHHFEEYNEKIHRWLAERIDGDSSCENRQEWVKHHYYMPTDSSIAIGTFAEPAGTQIPLFSAPGKPVYIFEIGKDNWQADLGGKKGKVCLVPHGWGQQIERIRSVSTDGENLLLGAGEEMIKIKINSKARIDCKTKQLRQFKDGEEFLRIGSRMVRGEIRLALTPVFQYNSSSRKRGR